MYNIMGVYVLPGLRQRNIILHWNCGYNTVSRSANNYAAGVLGTTALGIETENSASVLLSI